MLLCEATAGSGVPVSVSVCVGSSCPFIVFDTADVDSAVDGAIEAAFSAKTDVRRKNKSTQESKYLGPEPGNIPSTPPGPLGAVRAGEGGGERGGPPPAPHGWAEMRRPVQRRRATAGGRRGAGGPAAGGGGRSR